MKFELKITKDILRKSMMCGVNNMMTSRNCAFALAFNELVPFVSVAGPYVRFISNTYHESYIVYTTEEQRNFIYQFDRLRDTPKERLNLPEQTFQVEIPDRVLSWWYDDHVKLAQAIANSTCLTPVEA